MIPVILTQVVSAADQGPSILQVRMAESPVLEMVNVFDDPVIVTEPVLMVPVHDLTRACVWALLQ